MTGDQILLRRICTLTWLFIAGLVVSAATNIQDAVDVAIPGDRILVQQTKHNGANG